jgi:hypothetical protein
VGFKPKQLNQNANSQNGDKKDFVPIVPEEGLEAVQIGLLVNLGVHKKLPKFAKDSAGKREQDENGQDKIIVPQEGKDLEQKVAVYVDLLSQTHDYGEEIGVKNIRLPLHPVSRGMSEGVNLTTVAPRDPQGNYIKGKPWLLASNSTLYKIAGVAKYDDGKKVSDVIFEANYKNPKLNDIGELLGKPFMMNVEVKKTEKDGNTYVNTKLKSPVPLMKGIKPEAALIPAISINFDDEDLLEEKDELGGVCKMDLLRQADLRKIVLAEDYEGSKIQEAVRQREDEGELIKKAKEVAKAIIDNDKEYAEVLEQLALRDGNAPAEKKEEKPKAAKPTKPKQEETPPVDFSDMDDDVPF